MLSIPLVYIFIYMYRRAGAHRTYSSGHGKVYVFLPFLSVPFPFRFRSVSVPFFSLSFPFFFFSVSNGCSRGFVYTYVIQCIYARTQNSGYYFATPALSAALRTTSEGRRVDVQWVSATTRSSEWCSCTRRDIVSALLSLFWRAKTA